MSNNISERVAQPQTERPVQQIKPPAEKRTENSRNEVPRTHQDTPTAASRHADKGRHVDRYA